MRIFLMICVLHLCVNSNGQGSLVLDASQTFTVVDLFSPEVWYPSTQFDYSIKSSLLQPQKVERYVHLESTNSENGILPLSIQLDFKTLINPVNQVLSFKDIISQDPWSQDDYAFKNMSEKVNYPSIKDIIRAEFSLVFIMKQKRTGINIGYLVEIARMNESYGMGVGVIINGLK